MSAKKDFIDKYLLFARQAENKTGISHLFILAQAALESGWGKYVKRNNFFGVKSTSANDNRQLLTTTEYSDRVDLKFPKIHSIDKLQNGRYRYKVDDWFKWYESPAEAFEDHMDFFFRNPRYSKALEKKSDPTAFAKEVAKAGYATDPDYANKLITIMEGISPIIPITHTNAEIELLESYSKFLEKEGYMDADWRAEEPYAIDTFLALKRKNHETTLLD